MSTSVDDTNIADESGDPAGEYREWHRVSPFGMFATMGVNPLTVIYLVVTLYLVVGMSVPKIILTALGVIIAFVLVSSIIWLNFSFHIGEDGVRIKKGVFSKTQLFIRYSRVQGVELTSTLLHRALDLVHAKLDTAGTAKQEGVLPGISPDIAEIIQEKVKAAILESEQLLTQSAVTDKAATSHQSSDATQLLQLPAPEIVRIGLTSNHVFLFLGFMAALLGPLAEFGLSSLTPAWLVDEGIPAWTSLGAGLLASVAAGIALTTITAMFAGSLASAFLRFFNFTLTRDNQQLLTNAGLFTVREQSVHQNKVQTMTVRQSFPRRLLNRVAIDLRQASSGPVANKKQDPNKNKLLIPLAQPALIDTVRQFALSERGADLDFERSSEKFAPISKRYIRARVIVFGLLPLIPSLLMALFGDFNMVWFAPLAAIWLMIVALLTWLRYQRWGVQAGEDTVAIRSGFLGHQITCFACEKVQSIDLTAHLLQERAGVANLTVHLASQKITVPYLPLQLANNLRNYLLYKVESSDAQTI